MTSLRIGIIEDEALTREGIAIHLKRMGHCVCCSYASADAVLADPLAMQADLLLIDVRLKGRKTGIDLAHEFQRQNGPPFLFLTSHSDVDTVQKAMAAFPVGYITKPFTFEDLYIGIELAKAKINQQSQGGRRIEVKLGHGSEWLCTDQILFLEADRSYVKVHLDREKLVLRKALGNFLELFEPKEMVRIHRSYAVNPYQIKSASPHQVLLGEFKLPLGRGYRNHFLDLLRHLGIYDLSIGSGNRRQ